MTVKIVFCDLDFTLLDNNRKVPLRNKEVIHKIDSLGVKFVVCTGRTKLRSKIILEDLGFYGDKNQYIANANGSIISNGNYDPIYSSFIDKEVVKQIVDVFLQEDITPIICGFDEYLEIHKEKTDNSKKDSYQNTYCTYEETVERLDDGFGALKMLAQREFENYSHPCIEKLNELLGDKIDISFSEKSRMEINEKGINKGQAVIRLCNYLNIPLENALVIGDNLNDVTMFELDKVMKACPSNACDEIKELSDYVAINDNDNSAVAEILERFICR